MSIYENCRPYWFRMFEYYNAKFPSLQPEDIKAAILKAICVATRRAKENKQVFHYIRRYVEGYILDLAWVLGFPFRIVKEDRNRFIVGEFEYISIYEESDDEDIIFVDEKIVDERNDFAEVELRDLLDKVLDPHERDVAKLLLDGYNDREIKEKLGCDDLEAIKESIRRKLAKVIT